MALAADLPNYAKLEHVSARAKKRSPLCGSSVSVELELRRARSWLYARRKSLCIGTGRRMHHRQSDHWLQRRASARGLRRITGHVDSRWPNTRGTVSRS